MTVTGEGQHGKGIAMVDTANLKSSWVIVDGLPVHFWQSTADFPPGAPVLIHLHGFGISGTYMLPTADLLAGDYRTFVPDLPGYGRSVHPGKVLSIPELAKALLSFMDALDIDKATLIGNSMGCLTAIETAYEAPNRIERLILVSAAGGPNNRPIFKGLAQLSIDGLRESPRMFTIAVPDYRRFGIINAFRLFWAMIHYPTVERATEVTVPTLAVLGSRDPLVNEANIVNGTRGNSTFDLIRIDGAAHAINYSHPRKLAHLIRQYLADEPFADDVTSDGTLVILRRHGIDAAESSPDAATTGIA
jgi:pimeloyl-ACP methyl ester carboxylesterase